MTLGILEKSEQCSSACLPLLGAQLGIPEGYRGARHGLHSDGLANCTVSDRHPASFFACIVDSETMRRFLVHSPERKRHEHKLGRATQLPIQGHLHNLRRRVERMHHLQQGRGVVARWGGAANHRTGVSRPARPGQKSGGKPRINKRTALVRSEDPRSGSRGAVLRLAAEAGGSFRILPAPASGWRCGTRSTGWLVKTED